MTLMQVDGRLIVVRVRSEPPSKERYGGGGMGGGMGGGGMGSGGGGGFGGPPPGDDAKLYVAFLPNDMDDGRLHEIFRWVLSLAKSGASQLAFVDRRPSGSMGYELRLE